MASGGPDLFVICKHCGAEVSPYITECPYCGNRIQKRAPKLDREGRITEKRARRSPSPTLGRLRRGEIPGIRHDTHPYGAGAIVTLSLVGALLWRTGAVFYGNLVPMGQINPDWWRIFTSPFIYLSTGYALITVGVAAIFGSLFERRHGTLLMLTVFMLGAVAGIGLSVVANHPLYVDGANGGAIALVTAWAIPDLIAILAKEDYDGDLLATGVLAAMVLLMPLVTPEASWVADAVGVSAGVLIGYPVARLHPV